MLRTRRQLLQGLAAAFVTGATVAGAGYMLLKETPRELTAIGARSSQIWLLDTDKSRTLFMLGAFDEGLIDSLPALVHADKKRIDLLVASNGYLRLLDSRVLDEYRVTQVISAQNDRSAPPPFANATIFNGSVRIVLGDTQVDLAIIGGQMAGTGSSEGNDPAWSATITRGGTSALLVSTGEAQELAGTDSVTLLGIPMVNDSLANTLHENLILVANERPDVETGSRIVLPGSEDPVVFVMEDDAISLSLDYES